MSHECWRCSKPAVEMCTLPDSVSYACADHPCQCKHGVRSPVEAKRSLALLTVPRKALLRLVGRG